MAETLAETLQLIVREMHDMHGAWTVHQESIISEQMSCMQQHRRQCVGKYEHARQQSQHHHFKLKCGMQRCSRQCDGGRQRAL
jgi:hypothetical protein